MFNTCGRVVFEISDGGTQQSEVDSGETSQSLFVFFGTYRTLRLWFSFSGSGYVKQRSGPSPNAPNCKQL